MDTESAETYLNQVWQLSIQERNKGIKLLSKIFSNLIRNPNEEKFKDLNFGKIAQKLKACDAFLGLLLFAGFVLSPNHQRLYFDDAKMSDLLDVNKLIQSKLNESLPNEQNAQITEEKKQCLDDNDEKKEIFNDDTHKQDTLISYLMECTGCNTKEVQDAVNAADNDANVALEILIQGTLHEHAFSGMDSTKLHLKELWKISEEQRMKGMKVFYKICSNVLDNLEDNNSKYHVLKYESLCKKFSECLPCIDLLQDAGFIKTEDGTKLVFDGQCIKKLSNVMQQMNDML